MMKDEKFQLVERFVLEDRQAHYRLAYSYVRNEQNALDIVQEATFKALRSIDRLEEPAYLKTWFYRILVNTALDFLRKHRRVSVVEEEALSSFLPSDVLDIPDWDLWEAIDRLPPTYRTIIVLRFFEDMKLDDIASVTDTNVNTVKTRLYAALRKLRVDIEEEL